MDTEKKGQKRPAVVLLSGGLDSSTALACAVNDGFEVFAITFLYGQRHSIELEKAREIAKYFNVKKHLTVELISEIFGGSALTDSNNIPLDRTTEEIVSSIPPTYVPARNTVFLAIAAAYAEKIGSYDIFIGVNAIDYSGYPDCRPEFIEAMEKAINLGTKVGVEGQKIKIHTPLLYLRKSEIIKIGLKLGVDYSLTWSCYNPQGRLACGRCDSCILRLKAFREAGLEDPIQYASRPA